MKRLLLLTISSIAIVSISNAQITKGTKLIGGNLSFSRSKTESDNSSYKSSSVFFSPSAGLALKDNRVLGLYLTYAHTKDYDDAYGGGIFYRQYLTLGKGFYLFGQASTGYTHYQREYPTGFDSKTRSRVNSLSLSLLPGVTYTISKKFHLEVSMNDLIGLHYRKSTETSYTSIGQSVSTEKGMDVSTNASPESNLRLGFRIALGK